MSRPPSSDDLPAGATPPMPAAKRSVSAARFLLLPIGLALILYLELKPDPSARDIPFLPHQAAPFLDANDFVNNLVGFGGLAAMSHYALSGWRREAGRRVLLRAAVVALAVAALEGAQALLPGRNCDWHDVVAGWIGVAAASVLWLRGGRLFPFSDR